MIVDVHAHLDFESFEKDLDSVIERAKEAGVITIITNGLDPETNRKQLALAEKYDIVKAALGYYPCEVDKVSEEEGKKEIEFIRKNKDKVIAIGEVGLDKKHDNNFEKQKVFFRKFIELSKELDKPIIVHSRFAEKETIEILEEMEAKKVVMHCFCGNKKLVQRCIDNKWYFSIPSGVVRTQQFQDNVAMIPLNRLLTETDAPFLTYSEDVKRSEPAHIVESIKKMAEIKGMDEEEMKKIIYSNYQRLFT